MSGHAGTPAPLQRDEASLRDGAIAVLRANDLGGWTRPAPRLYPHQWSWDSAFIAMGLAHLDPDRALRELESLFVAQWTDGRVPHIVYNPAAPPDAYFPDASRYACADCSDAAPKKPGTSGLCQPPIHALAVWRILEAMPDPRSYESRFRALYEKLLAWHCYLVNARDPEGSGLLTIYHPWESGTDNSPRWDATLANVEVGAMPPYVRRDLQHVSDPSQRPTDAEYDRYVWLIESLRAAGYEDAAVHRTHPFLIKDVLFSAIFAAANYALFWLANWLMFPSEEQSMIANWGVRFGEGVEARWDYQEQLALDLDLRTGEAIRVHTWAGLSPILWPDEDASLPERVVERLFGPDFVGVPTLAYPAVPSTAVTSPDFRPRTYWRGPIWPIANWLLWWGLQQHNYGDEAEALRAANLALLGRPGARFGEYFEPLTGESLGSADQSWTAAVVLDWLAER